MPSLIHNPKIDAIFRLFTSSILISISTIAIVLNYNLLNNNSLCSSLYKATIVMTCLMFLSIIWSICNLCHIQLVIAEMYLINNILDLIFVIIVYNMIFELNNCYNTSNLNSKNINFLQEVVIIYIGFLITMTVTLLFRLGWHYKVHDNEYKRIHLTQVAP
jgi:hypothetical protein